MSELEQQENTRIFEDDVLAIPERFRRESVGIERSSIETDGGDAPCFVGESEHSPLVLPYPDALGEFTNTGLDDESVLRNTTQKTPLYCAKCFHSFCIPQPSSEQDSEFNAKEYESDADSSDSESDDSVSPIFREDPEDVEELILDEIAEYMKLNPLVIWRASFERDLVKDIATGLFEEWREDNLCEEYDLQEIQDWVKQLTDYYFKTESDMPPRQGGSGLQMTPLRSAIIRNKLRIINALPTQQQKTQEWYETRYGLLTASNVWKAIGTEAQQNQLIVEKCVPFDKFREDCARHGNLSPDNPMAWGQKYEPISALIYEKMNATRLGEYGCIVHPSWRFLGASPDGINLDPESEVYGRMVEIKNIVNRNIDGIPLDAYWVQMQIQMEVCNLDECDFVETRIKEYPSKYEFFESDNQWKGIVLTFVPRVKIESRFPLSDETPLGRLSASTTSALTESFDSNALRIACTSIRNSALTYEDESSSVNPRLPTLVPRVGVLAINRTHQEIKPFYEYLLIDHHDQSPDKTVENWMQMKRDQHVGFVLQNGVYWGLDQYSCVLVKRNRAWFAAAIPKIERIWQIIEKERITGCEHRAPKKQKQKTLIQSECVVFRSEE